MHNLFRPTGSERAETRVDLRRRVDLYASGLGQRPNGISPEDQFAVRVIGGAPEQHVPNRLEDEVPDRGQCHEKKRGKTLLDPSARRLPLPGTVRRLLKNPGDRVLGVEEPGTRFPERVSVLRTRWNAQRRQAKSA